MKTTNRLILVLSDLHVGSTVGLWPADFVSNEGNPIGQNHFQKWLWKCWVDMNEWVAKVTDGQPYDIVINGDIVDGIHHKTLQVMTPDLGDQVTAVKQILGELMDRSRMPSVGTTAKAGIVTIRIRAEGNAIDAQRALDATVDVCRSRVSNIIFGRDEDTLESSVGALLLAHGATLATAESCTGGLVSARLTDVPGSSAWFKGGFVVYANERKMEDLGVPSSVLDEFGAVSHATAVALARGALRRTTSDYAISTTGVAGPTGGSLEKPVGTVFIAIADRARAEVCSRRFQMTGSRQTIRERSTVMALAALRNALLENPLQSLLWAESERVHVEPL